MYLHSDDRNILSTGLMCCGSHKRRISNDFCHLVKTNHILQIDKQCIETELLRFHFEKIMILLYIFIHYIFVDRLGRTHLTPVALFS